MPLQYADNFWSIPAAELVRRLNSGYDGLSEAAAAARLREQQSAEPVHPRRYKDAFLLLSQYRSPLVLLLAFAAALSMILGEYPDSLIVLTVLLLTGLLGFIQERNAGKAVEKLQAMVRNKAMVRRQGIAKEVAIAEVVPGDIILLSAGDIIPADGLILEADDLHVNEAILTGESYPAEKGPGCCAEGTPLTRAGNAVFKATNIVSGSAVVLAVNTGRLTALGKITAALEKAPVETAFEKGIRRFGFFLMRITIVIALLILILNILFRKPVVDSMLFALALAVGMTPELLPAIITITLSAGARRMAAKKVIVKKLNAIQNLGEMDTLCCDKTGTLTEGVVKVHAATDYRGRANSKVLQYARLNALYETGFFNPIDEAIRNIQGDTGLQQFSKQDEVPYDFIRKRLSIVVNDGGRHIMITKGAVRNILECCTKAALENSIADIAEVKDSISEQFTAYSRQGLRTMAICYKDVSDDPVITKEDETDMIFIGFITLFDPPKEGVAAAIKRLREAGIGLKLISGDNELVVSYLAGQIGLQGTEVLTGADLMQMTDDALQQRVEHVEIFAEITPMQKERIIKALQQRERVVGFLGDGINDAGALKSADVGISVDSAVDIAKESAAIVLLEKDIEVIREGVAEGRTTFMNTLKYIFVATSANFGNMLSMAVASLVLPFLPLLATQILLNNFLSDIPSLSIGSDRVDPESLAKPRRWNMQYIQRFMVVFGLQSSLFDILTFGMLLYFFHTGIPEFRSAWFTESLLTQVLTLLIIRTHRPLLQSQPGKLLLLSALLIIALALLLPYLPFAQFFGLFPLPGKLLAGIGGITVMYVITAELTKRWVMKRL